MKTVLVGLDGATYTILDHLVAEGVMPNLGGFYRHGARCRLRSTPMPITPQAWTSLATGRSPGNHGFTDFVRFEFGPNGPVLRFNTSSDNHCEPVWYYASRKGRRVTALNFIGIAPPREINGHTMPGFVPSRHMRLSSHPPDLLDRLKTVEGLDVKLLGLNMDVEREALQEMPAERWLEWIDHQIERDRAWFRVLQRLMLHEPSDLTAVVFDGVDKIQHLAYRFLDPALAPRRPDSWEADVAARCKAYFRQIDDFLGFVLDVVGDDGRVFIASDHGFCATTEIVYVNKWLHDEGLLRWKTSAAEDHKESIVVERLTKYFNNIDWEQTRAFALTPSCNGIYIINVPPAEYDSFRARLADGLGRIRGADGGRVITGAGLREEWFPGPCMNRTPDLTLVLRDHGFISVLNAPAPVVQRKEPAGTHHPDGVLLGMGPGLRRGVEVERRDIMDVTPLLVHSLGLEIPADYEGAFPESLYEPAHLSGHPARIASDGGGAGDGTEFHREAREEAGGGMSDEDQMIILERLRSLGYVE